MTYHAKRSPSSAHRWMRCPGSLREEAKYPSEPSGPAAVAGTHTHTLVEHCVNGDLCDPTKMVGVTLKDHEGEFKVDADQAERAKVAIDYVRQCRDNTGPIAIRPESRVDPTPLIGVEGSDGTSDIILVTDDLLEVIDYKDGMKPVSPEDNEQMELYSLGVLAQYVNAESIESVKMTIIQPKLRLKGLTSISSHTLSVSELKAKAFGYQIGAMATEDPDAPLVPGETQCLWCRAKQNCKAYADYSSEAVGLDVINMVEDAAEGDPNSMSDERLREIITAAPLIRSLIEGAEKEALKRIEAGQEIDGLKTVKGRGSYSWALDEEEIAERLGKMGIPKQARYITKVVSPAQVKKLAWTKKVKGEDVTKKLSDRQIKTLDAEYIKKSEGSLKVVPESDERKAVSHTNVAELFKPKDNDETPDWMKGEVK